MGIVNRRNAVVGWVMWRAWKRAWKRRAKAAVPTVDPESVRLKSGAAALLAATAVGAATFWRRRAGHEGPPDDA